MSYLYFIGIDISKDSFEVAFHSPQEKTKTINYPNNLNGFNAFFATLHNPQKTFAVLEATGGYETNLLLFLCNHNLKIHRLSPLKSSHYMRSIKSYAKNDVLDSQALARYAFERYETLQPFTLSSEKQLELHHCFSRKQDLIEMRKAEKQRLKHPNYDNFQDNIHAVIQCLNDNIADLDVRMLKIIDECDNLKHIQKLLLTQKGIGKEVSLCLMANLPEIGLLDRKQIASMTGLAPHPKESGAYKGYRSCRGGRMGIKRMMFMAGLSAIRFNKKLKIFYKGLCQRGKKPMVALVATMRKFIVILNAKVRDLLQAKSLTTLNHAS